MPARKPNAKRSTRATLRRAVFTELGVRGRKPLAVQTMPEIQGAMEPYAGRPYPTRMTSDRSRVPMEFSKRGWQNPQIVAEKLLKNPGIAQIVLRNPKAKSVLMQLIEIGLQERAVRAYGEEWKSLTPETIAKGVVGRATTQRVGGKEVKPTPLLANEFNAGIAAPRISNAVARLGTGKLYTIADLGSGGGGTILPIIERVPKQQRAKLRVVLVDVMKVGLREASAELQKLGVPAGQIVAINTNMAKLASNQKAKEFFGAADLVTSGAAMHHTSKIEPVFEGAKRLLKNNGEFIFWDWGHPAWRAPNLIIAPEGARVEKYGQYYEKGTRTREAPEQHAFISREQVRGVTQGWAPTELAATREMLSTWVGLLKYSPAEKERFLSWFDRAAKRGEPINLAEYIKRLEGRPLETGMKPAEIKFWEGHRPPEFYHEAMRKVGLIGNTGIPSTRYSTQSPLLYQMMVKKNV
ncbi:MAG: class I SAM-dependent methyltransferase [Candidatus Diapherotrites archaeon]